LNNKNRVRTTHILHFDFKACTAHSSVCGAATHAIGGDAGYGLLKIIGRLIGVL